MTKMNPRSKVLCDPCCVLTEMSTNFDISKITIIKSTSEEIKLEMEEISF